MASVHARLIRSLTQMGGGPALGARDLAGTAAIFGASAVCTVAYTLWGRRRAGTHKAPLGKRRPMPTSSSRGRTHFYPEVGKPKFNTMNILLLMAAASANDARVLLLASTSVQRGGC